MRNVNLPKTRVYVRCDAFGGSALEFESAWLVSVRAIRHRPLVFQVWVDQYAACYDKIPPHCLYWRRPEHHQPLPLHKVQLWESLSGSLEYWRKDQLADVPVLVNLGGGQSSRGHYWFTLDFLPEPVEIGDVELLEEHKEANVIRLDSGQIAIYPNNRLRWMPGSLTPKGSAERVPAWEVATNERWDEWWDDSGEQLGDASWAY